MARARVSVEADRVKFRSGLAEMRRDFREFTTDITEKAQGAGELIGIALGAEAFKSIIEGYDQINQQAKKMGEAPEVIQRIGMVAKQSGTDIGTLDALMNKLDISVEKQSSGVKDFSQYWEMLGVSASQFAGANMDQKLDLLAQGFDHAERKGQGLLALTGLMGKNAATLIPLLARGSDDIKQIMENTTVATEQQVQDMEKINDQVDEIENSAKVGIVSLVEALNFGLQMVGLGLQTLVTDAAWAFNKLTGFGDEFYEKMQKQNDQWSSELAQGVLEYNNLNPDGSPKDNSTAREKQKKLAREALASTDDTETAGESKAEASEETKEAHREAEGRRKAYEEKNREEKSIADLQRDTDRSNRTGAVDEDADPKGAREARKLDIKIEAINDRDEAKHEFNEMKLTREEYLAKVANVTAHENKDLGEEDKKERREDKATRRSAFEVLLSQKEKAERGEIGFDVDSFRSRGGGGRVGTGGGMSAELNALNKQIALAISMDASLAALVKKAPITKKTFK